jgi:hypothetical protein
MVYLRHYFNCSTLGNGFLKNKNNNKVETQPLFQFKEEEKLYCYTSVVLLLYYMTKWSQFFQQTSKPYYTGPDNSQLGSAIKKFLY